MRKAAVAVGIDPARVTHLSSYDFRHARGTLLCEQSSNLPGIAYLLGHVDVATTSRHDVHPSRRAAIATLATALRAGAQISDTTKGGTR